MRACCALPQVLLNGHKSRLTYGVSAYVTQDEVLVGTLSVRETLLYAALLRLPAKMAYADKVGGWLGECMAGGPVGRVAGWVGGPLRCLRAVVVLQPGRRMPRGR